MFELKDLRHNTNKTQDEIAKTLNISQGEYSRFEQGQIKQTLQRLTSVLSLFNNLDLLFDPWLISTCGEANITQGFLRLVKDSRKTLGLNQAYMGKVLSMSRSNYAAIESGKVEMSLEVAVELDRFLDLNCIQH